MIDIPKHIAVIMDGNGRWAKKQGAIRIFGHKHAIKAVRETIEFCIDYKLDYLTLYTFSTENWLRPKIEVNNLMDLLFSTIIKETPSLVENNIKLLFIGDLKNLPSLVQKRLKNAILETNKNNGLNLILALNYSGRWDLENTMRAIAKDVKADKLSINDINQDLISSKLSTRGIPDPELLIRTSGEMRISNFLLWQLAYTELYFTDVLWPDFRKKHMQEAIQMYARRERRFGKISEQLIG